MGGKNLPLEVNFSLGAKSMLILILVPLREIVIILISGLSSRLVEQKNSLSFLTSCKLSEFFKLAQNSFFCIHFFCIWVFEIKEVLVAQCISASPFYLFSQLQTRKPFLERNIRERPNEATTAVASLSSLPSFSFWLHFSEFHKKLIIPTFFNTFVSDELTKPG